MTRREQRSRGRRRLRPATVGWPALLAGAITAACTGPQHVLDPRSTAAARIADLWWVMFALAAVVSVAVSVLLLFAVDRSRRRGEGERDDSRGRRLVWGGGVVVPVLVLFTVLVYSFRVGRDVYPPTEAGADHLTIEVIGHQFWWEVRYPDHGVTTANEIHIPAGRRVRFLVSAPDVIHSFWIPQLHGKIDMIPGRLNTLWVEAERPGLFRGQCAEYCGAGHALMSLWVVALPADDFTAWLDRRGRGGAPAEGEEAARGAEVFFAAGCGQCHATRGAPLPPGMGSPAPDLTDLATRRTLAAGTIPNTRRGLQSWIADPQRIKPGSLMPPTALPAGAMGALLTYLESLR